jgi:hypothetical protein
MAKSSILLLALLAATSSAFTAPQFATRAVGKAAPAKKVVAKAAPVKKVVAKAAPVKKVVAKPTKVVAKKVVAKPVVKKAVAKKDVAKPVAKPVVKKAFANPFAKKAVVKADVKPVAKKAVAKPVVKKAVVKKAVVKPVVKKAAPVKKIVAKPAVVKKAAPARKIVPGKPSALANLLGDIKRKAPVKPKLSIRAPPAARTQKTGVYVYDDGLTEIERIQRASIPAFLSGSAKPSKIKSDLRPDLYSTGDNFFFSPADTTVATISLFLLLSFIVKAGSGQ